MQPHRFISQDLCLVLLLILVPALGLADGQKERNPFVPSWDAAANGDGPKVPSPQDLLTSPLVVKPLSMYRVIGIIVAPKTAFALVRTPENYDYFLEEGQKIGSEGGVAEEISIQGVKIKVNKDIVTLPVSNKVEIRNDKN
ncbi:MAG: hypothetical protein K0R63_620 [Rickettsiales bacterium]|jgi:Tfp pilus assembly protein PilP|nr:hypothetical protein [Rickettsiales bacterium]